MTRKLIETIGIIIFLSIVGFSLILLSVIAPTIAPLNIALKLPTLIAVMRLVMLFLGIACVGFACHDYLEAHRIADSIDTKIDTIADYVETYTSKLNSLEKDYYDDRSFSRRVDTAYFRRDQYGNRFMPGHLYAQGDVTACHDDNKTVEQIRKAVRKSAVLPNGDTIAWNQDNKCLEVKTQE